MHVRYALDAGLSQCEIDQLGGGQPLESWDDEDAALIRAADELHDRQDITEDTWHRLALSWDEAQLVEIPFVVGQYTMLSMVAKSTGVPVDEDLQQLPPASSAYKQGLALRAGPLSD